MMNLAAHDQSEVCRRALLGKRLSWALAGGLAVFGLATLSASYVSYARAFRSTIGASSADQVLRGADVFAAAFHYIVIRLRYCSVGFLLAAVLATARRDKVQIWIEKAVLQLPRFLRDVARSLVRGLRADGKLNSAMLLALSLLGLALRLRFLYRPIRFDEADSFLSFASRPLYVGLSYYPEPNNHLFHTLLMHFSWRLLGDHEWALRLPVLIAGTLLIPTTYWAARTLYDRNSALIAASLVSVASPLIGYSVEGRGYIILCVLFLLLLITSQYLLQHDSPPAWLAWALLASLGFYTIPIMLYAESVATSWLIVCFWMDPKGLRSGRFAQLASALFLTGVFTTLLYLPVVLASGWKPLFSNRWVQARTIAYLLANLPKHAHQTWTAWTTDLPLPLVVVLTTGLGIALFGGQSSAGPAVPPLATAVCILPLVVAQRVIPFERVWLFLLPLCAITSGAGLWRLIRRLGGRAETSSARFAVVVVTLGLFALMGQYTLRSTSLTWDFVDGIESSVIWMKRYLRPNDVLLAWEGTRAPLKYYLRRYSIPLLSRPAPCGGEIVEAFTRKVAGTEKPTDGEKRILLITVPVPTDAVFKLMAICSKGRAAQPRLVYQHAGIVVYESMPRTDVPY